MRAPTKTADFESKLERWAAPLRLRMLLRELLGAAAVGSLVAAAGLTAAWWLRASPLVQSLLVAALPGAFVLGALRYRARRWSCQELALYIDAKLETREALCSALVADSAAATPLSAAVLARASSLLAKTDPRMARPRLVRRHHWALIPGIALVALMLQLPPRANARPEAAAALRPPSAHLLGLEAVEALSRTPTKDPEQAQRLRRIAAEARRLRAASERGLERTEALSRVASLRDQVRAERLTFGDAAARPGREAAVTAMATHPALARAAKALGDGDLSAFDDSMQRLASELEARDRRTARALLAEAARRAQERGNPELARLLREAEARLEKVGASLDSLRTLAEALGSRLDEEQRSQLESLSRSGSPKDHAQLAESLARALAQLDPAERRSLAERLRERIASAEAGGSPLTQDALSDLAKRLAGLEGEKELAEALKQLANSAPLDDARREAELGRAERGLGEVQRQLSAIPVPTPGRKGSASERSGAPNGSAAVGGPASAGRGGNERDASGRHDGPSPTAPLDVSALRAKADARLLPGLPMRGSSLGRAPARPGERAEFATDVTLRAAGPQEMRGVERPEIPEEYRDHVGRYFNP